MTTLFLTYVQETSLARWVAESPSLWGYPTILALHTAGLAMLVGASIAVNLRLLGVARGGGLGASAPLFQLMWVGLGVNAVTGVLLFIADAVHKSEQPVFWIKLACIAGALVVLFKTRSIVLTDDRRLRAASPGFALAWVSLLLWTGAIVSGRLMAYL